MKLRGDPGVEGVDREAVGESRSMDGLPAIALVAVVGYLLGTIPTGVLVARARGVDLTQIGSRRTGSTNVLRSVGKKAAAVVFLGDFLKGSVAVLVARAVAGDAAWPQVVGATAAVIGHSYSPWIGWRGGRGVVTAMGGLVLIWPQAFAIAFVVGFIAIAVTRYVSLGSITGTIMAGLVVMGLVIFAGAPYPHVFYAIALPFFILLSHRDNINRLIHGTERKLGEKT